MIVLFTRQYAEELIRFTERYEPQVRRYLNALWRAQGERLKSAEIAYAVQNSEVPLEWVFAWQDDYSRFINDQINPLWRKAIEQAGGIVARSITENVAPFSFTPSGQHIVAWIESRSGELIRNLTNTQVQAVRNLLRHYLVEEPKGPQEMARILRSCVGLTEREMTAAYRLRDNLLAEGVVKDKVEKQVERYIRRLHSERGMRIARTEMSYAWNWGEYGAITEAQGSAVLPPSLKKEWITALDELVCETCSSVDGEQVDKESNFSNGCFLPPAHPRCRCTHAYIVEG